MAGMITESELLDALAAAMPGKGPESARTVDEIVRASKISATRVRDALHELATQSRLVVHQVSRPRLDGRLTLVPAYEILPPVKKSPRASRRR